MVRKEKEEKKKQDEIDTLARGLLPEIQRFFESEEGQKEFREWKRKQRRNKRAG